MRNRALSLLSLTSWYTLMHFQFLDWFRLHQLWYQAQLFVKIVQRISHLETHDHFNLSQLDAIRSSHSNRLTLIQGPPGTGRTHVACEIISKQNAKHPDKHILAVAETNMAVDNMTIRLQKMGLRVMQIGSEAKISPKCSTFDN